MKPSTILFSIIFLGLLALTAAAGAYLVYVMGLEKEAEEERSKTIPVHVVEVKRGDVEDVVFISGTVEAAERVDVLAKIPMPGKLIEARVEKGDRVKRDQIIMTVDRDEVGAIYRPYGVKAPAAGIIATIVEDPGALITAQQPVASIIDIDKVKVKTSLIEADLGRVDEGTRARVMVDAYPDRVFEGEVTRISEVLDEFSHTAPIEVTVENPDHKLLPAMFARLELVADKKEDAIVLPKRTVLKRQGKDRVFKVTETEEDGKKSLSIILTDLDLGYYDQKSYEVISGVKEGDLVVDQDLVILKDRIQVSLLNPPEGWETYAASVPGSGEGPSSEKAEEGAPSE